MHTTNLNFKTKLKDWFIIQKIRLLNFIKEHKYVTSFISIFLVSSVVALIVFATGESVGYATIESVVPMKVNSTEQITSINSFSTIVYEVSYIPSSPTVEIEASIPSDIDAVWDTSDPTSDYELSDDNKRVKIKIYDNVTESKLTKQLYLNVRNVENGKVITPKITSGDSVLQNTSVTVTSTEVALTTKIISGVAYKSEDYSEGRLAPYGILVGIDKGNLNSLEGLYFKPDLDLVLEASQTLDDTNYQQIELENDNEKYFGLYDKDLNLLTSMPHYKLDYQNYSVYDSGKVESLTKTEGSVSGVETEENNNPELYLIGEKSMNLEVGDTYTEYGVSQTMNGIAICKTSSSTCKRTITNESLEEISDVQITNNPGNYIISYEYKTEKGSTKISRSIKVSNKTTVTLNEDTYSLKGNKNITLLKGTAYKDSGINKNNNTFINYDTEIKKDDEIIPEVDVNTVGTYTITYTITTDSSTESQIEESTEEETTDQNNVQSVSLTRTVNVIENLQYLKAQTLSANALYISSNGSFKNPTIKLDGELLECTLESGCIVEYYDSITNKKTEINPNKAGTYIAKYKINDKNGFELQTSNFINFQTKYSLKIKGIKSDGNFYLYDNFIVFGSYFVNAKSPRAEGVTTDIAVNLKIGDVTSQKVINKYYSKGVKTNKLTLNTDMNGTLVSLGGNDNLAYGEEVILKSEFYYSGDGDENIESLTTTIPIGNATSTASNPTAPFTMAVYSSKIEESKPYYINMAGVEETNEVVNYYACEMNEASTKCKDGTTISYLDSDMSFDDILADIESKNLKLAYLTYTIKNVSPGTKIDFRIRLRTNVGNQGGIISLNSVSSFDEKQELGDKQTVSVSGSCSTSITAFKARTKVFIENSDSDVIINGATVNRSLWTVYPTVSLPAETINTNVAGIDELNYVKVEVTLPNGINYLYNENYDIPTISDNGKKLTYVLNGKHINEWIEPILFETSYDINIPSGTVKEIKVIIQAESKSKITDSSVEELRTTIRKITYQNNNIISSSIYTPYTAIPKETSFTVSTQLYNNDSSNATHSNLDIVTILPYNDINAEKSTFSGTYTISDLPNGALCSISNPQILISDQNALLSSDEINWKSCDEYSENDYLGVTAIRVNGISLKSAQTYEQSIKINPISNKTDDSYQINSYLVMDDKGQRKAFNIKALNVSVISKKISGNVWEDFDANGIMDAKEKKVSDVTLKLYNAKTDELIKTTITDEKGKYNLSDLDPGTYYVVAEYNTAKYGLSPYQVSFDKSITSSFKTSTFSGASEKKYILGDVDFDGVLKSVDARKILQYIEGEIEFDDIQKILADVNKDGDIDEEDSNLVLEIISGNKKEETISIPNENKVDSMSLVRTDNIEITNNTRAVNNVNLGLALRKIYSVKLTKYVTKATTINKLGVTLTKDYGNATLAKLDVKDINNLSIKVVYTLELENIGYYPGYIYAVKDYIPDGMSFNENYEENKGWIMTEYGYLENNTLFDQIVSSGEKKYLTIAFDVTRKEAGSFINYASVDDEDLQILVVAESEEGDNNE